MKAIFCIIASSLTLSLSAACFTEPECCPPSQKPVGCCAILPSNRCIQFELYGDLLFLQPNGSNLYYAVKAIPLDPTITVPAVSPNWTVYEIFPHYSAGFKIGGKLLFTETDTNLEVNWERLHTERSGSNNVPLITDMIGPLFDIGPNSAAYLDARGKGKFHFDAVDLLFAQQCCIFQRLYPSIYAGAEFALIKQTMRSYFTNHIGATSRSVSYYSTFTGAGPKFGLDFDYRIYRGFFFSGTTSLGLIIGQLQNGTTFESTSPDLATLGIPQPNIQTTTVPNRTQLIPALEEKLGFTYSALFKCSRIALSFGYQAQIYMDAVQSIDMTAPQVLPSLVPGPSVDDGVYAVGFERTLSNFILTGPYISLTIDF